MRLGKLNSARQAWHDAFMDGVRPMEFGLQGGSKGVGKNDLRICGHVEQGMVQQVIHKLRQKDRVAWAFGMIAYMPDGSVPPEAHAVMNQWYRKKMKTHDELKEFVGTRIEVRLLALFRVAYTDIAFEDRSGVRKRRRYEDLAKLLQVDADIYKNKWHQYFVWARSELGPLPGRALPSLSSFLWDLESLAQGDDGAFEKLRKTLTVDPQLSY